VCCLGRLVGKEGGQVGMKGFPRFHGKASRERIHGGIGQHVGRVEVKLATPDEPRLLALRDDRLEEAAKDRQPVAGTDAGQAGMVGQGLIQVVPQIPADTQPVSGQSHEVAFGSDPVEKQHQLELEEDDWINRGAASVGGVAVLHQITYKREIEHTVQVAVEMVARNQVVKGERAHRREEARLCAQHGKPP
jgi:hypothetical protein